MTTLHVPVLLNEILALLHPDPDAVILDGTVGSGGHAEALLTAAGPKSRLIGLDVDPGALAAATKRFAPFGDRVRLVKGSYKDATAIVSALPEFHSISTILLDLGLSSLELEESGRGFSFRHPEEPLDMRFDPEQTTKTAEFFLATVPEQELANVLRNYGEEPEARRIAHEICARRRKQPFLQVKQLTDAIVASLSQRPLRGRVHLHPAARTFQAIRIAVNDELETLRASLPPLLELLLPGGRMAVISFHSLEDRIVKDFFRTETRGCICPPELPECRCGHSPKISILTKHVVTPSEDELAANPRSRSAKLRAAEKRKT